MSDADHHATAAGDATAVRTPPEAPAGVQDHPHGRDGVWPRVKRTIWGSTRRRIVSVAAALVVALLIASGLRGGPEVSLSSACTTGPVEHNVRVTFYGELATTCADFNRGAATSGEYWQVVRTGNRVEGSELVCSLAGEGALVEVRDTGQHLYGNRICAIFTARGWTQEAGPREKAERAALARKAREEENRREAEKPILENSASELRAEATSLREKQHHEEQLAKADETESHHLEAASQQVETEEPEEGGGHKYEEAGKLMSAAGEYESQSGERESNAYSDGSEAESKEEKAAEDETRASED